MSEFHCARCGYGREDSEHYDRWKSCLCGITGFVCDERKHRGRCVTSLRISEGVSGLWHYHLSGSELSLRGLCGRSTMTTSIPLRAWRVPFGEHFPKRPTWCERCEELFETLKKEGYA